MGEKGMQNGGRRSRWHHALRHDDGKRLQMPPDTDGQDEQRNGRHRIPQGKTYRPYSQLRQEGGGAQRGDEGGGQAKRYESQGDEEADGVGAVGLLAAAAPTSATSSGSSELS